MKINSSFFVSIFFLLLGLYIAIQALTFRHWESVVLPAALGIIIFIMAAVEVGKGLSHQDKQEAFAEEKSHAGTQDRVEIRRFSLIFGWAAAFMLTTYLVGFYIAVPSFALFYVKWRGRRWLTATIFAIAVLAFIYSVFELFLKAPLFKGLIFTI